MGLKEANGVPDLERFREYLRYLARFRIPPRYRAKIDASDVVQETMLEAHQGWKGFRGTQDRELMAWLRRILSHNLDDAFKGVKRDKRNIERERSFEQLDHASERLGLRVTRNQSTPSRRLSREEEALRLAGALSRLPEAQREAVELHYLQCLSLKEVAAALARSEPAVAGLINRGLKGLREALGGLGS